MIVWSNPQVGSPFQSSATSSNRGANSDPNVFGARWISFHSFVTCPQHFVTIVLLTTSVIRCAASLLLMSTTNSPFLEDPYGIEKLSVRSQLRSRPGCIHFC